MFRITVFLPFDDFLLYTFFPHENFSMSDSPLYTNYNYRVDFPQLKSNAFIYLRNDSIEFLKYLKSNFNLVLYSTGTQLYNETIMNLIDRDKEFFGDRIYGDEYCHLVLNKEEEYTELIKDINLFTGIPVTRKVLIDTGSMSELMSPDNGK
jgi:TFIIF-interacting CTD phosphatase-like protein